MSEGKRKRIDGLETMEKIVEFAERELKEHGLADFNLTRVIEQSGVSRGSVYHHFLNREGTIAAVEVKQHLLELEQSNALLRHLVESVSSFGEIFDALRVTLERSSSEEGRSNRRRRNATMVTAQTIPALSEAISVRQVEGDEHLAETLQIAADRGIIELRMPAQGIAHWISSLFIGRLAVDILNDPASDQAWIDVTLESIRHLLEPQSNN